MNAHDTTGGGDEPGEADCSSPHDADPPEHPVDPDQPCIDVRSRKDAAIDLPWLTHALRRAVKVAPASIARLSVEIVDDDAMAGAHLRACGIEGPTDVLTFPASRPGRPIEVDILVNADEAQRQGSARAHPLERELLLYALHGMLHCAGFDDHDDADYRRMHAEEDRILSAIGVGATFDRPDRSRQREGRP